jgi:polyhydroxybutyrate depolymerase
LYDGVTPLPLVLNYHGLGSNIVEQIFVSDLYPRADAQGFLVATPQGVPTSGWPVNHWNTLLSPGPSNNDDVLFSSKIIDDVAAQVCVDVAHVYATGMSNGAEMSVRLGCSLSARIAAIAPVAGSYYPPLTPILPSESCPDTRPMPVIAFHGTGDMTIPFNGGAGLNGIVFRDIDDVVIPAWATHNGCTVGPTTSLAAPGINLIEYSSCDDGATVQLYAVFDYDGDGPATTGGTHIWPGSPYMPSGSTNAIEATDLMLAFFSQFSVPCAAGDGDCDSVADASDNCLSAYNPGQQNSDGNFLNLHPTKSFDDLSQPSSDLVGDACDLDDDNDGRSDADETGGIGCGGVVTDPFDADSDGDNYLDGAECNVIPNTDPTQLASRPTIAQCGTTTDADGDGLPASREVCFYNTDPNNANTDGDSCRDGREVASNNANNGVDVLDLLGVAQEAGTYGLPGSAVKVDFDATKNGSIDVLDLGFVAAQAGSCP